MGAGKRARGEGNRPEPEPSDRAPSDLSLLARARSGDLEAYGQLVERHMRRAFSIAYRIVRHREDAEDVVQDAFIRTLEHIDRIELARGFQPWLYRVVTNRAVSFLRSRSVRTADPLDEGMHQAPTPAPDRVTERHELREDLLRALDSLPDRQRTIVLLADLEGFTSVEIGEILEMPAGTVRYQLHLARRALRVILAHTVEEER